MHVGIIDVGSNTTRLLVAHVDGDTVVPIEKARVRLALGAEIERTGVVSDASIAAAAEAVGSLCARARRRRVVSLDVFLTAPGRQSKNSEQLVAALQAATAHRVRVLSAEHEGRLAYAGAVASAEIPLPDTIAVCDVGGASTEIAVGDPHHEPAWVRSVDLGSVRLAARADQAAEAAAAFAPILVPRVEVALAVGGSARAARRLVGPELGRDELAEAQRIVATTSQREVSRRYGLHKTRAAIVGPGLELLVALQRLLDVPLHVCSGGIREGAALATARALRAA